jgi:predicted Zn-dependent peptidase
VILEELAMNDDDPTDVVHEQFAAAVLGLHPLGRPIGGTPTTIRAVPRAAVWEHFTEHYQAPTLVVTAAGGVDHDALCAQVLDEVGIGGWATDPSATPVPRRATAPRVDPGDGAELIVHRATEQANVIVGCAGLASTDERRFALSLLTTVLGGGMSSRLFQEVREKRGLAYSVYAFSSGHADTGLLGLYAGCAPARVDEVVDLMVTEWERLASDGITVAERERAVGQMSGGLILGLEDSGSRMTRLGKAELVHGELLSQAESLERIHAVTAEDVRSLAAELAALPRSVVRVGPFGG